MLPVRSTTILLLLVRKFLIGSLEVLPFSIMSAITVAFTEEAFLSHVRKTLRELEPYVSPKSLLALLGISYPSAEPNSRISALPPNFHVPSSS
jgi:hypothetical protein